ncbi:MAG TPA: phage holin family protein, partial [Paralcaligenes sp.]
GHGRQTVSKEIVMALARSIGGLAGTLVSIARTRIELFSLEASEQKGRLIKLICMVLGGVLFLMLAIVALSLLIVAYFWSTEYRYLASWLLVLFYGALGLGLLLAVRHALVSEPGPFAATLDELRRDMAMIDRLREPVSGASGTDRPVPAERL